jgi:hypothetical protein
MGRVAAGRMNSREAVPEICYSRSRCSMGKRPVGMLRDACDWIFFDASDRC